MCRHPVLSSFSTNIAQLPLVAPLCQRVEARESIPVALNSRPAPRPQALGFVALVATILGTLHHFNRVPKRFTGQRKAVVGSAYQSRVVAHSQSEKRLAFSTALQWQGTSRQYPAALSASMILLALQRLPHLPPRFRPLLPVTLEPLHHRTWRAQVTHHLVKI